MDLKVVWYNILTDHYPHSPEMGFDNNIFILIFFYL